MTNDKNLETRIKYAPYSDVKDQKHFDSEEDREPIDYRRRKEKPLIHVDPDQYKTHVFFPYSTGFKKNYGDED